MTVDEAIDKLTSIMSDLNDFCNESKHMSDNDEKEMESLNMAIKALKQEPCDDCVSRKEVFETFGELLGVWGRKALMELPSVTPSHVTCKNCKHYEDILAAIDKDGNKKILHICKKYEKGVSEDWYCPDAERGERE